MRILFITPPLLYSSWPHLSGGSQFIYNCPPINFQSLAGTVPGHTVRFIDAAAAAISLKEYRRYLEWSDIVGINLMSGEHALNSELNIRFIRKLFPRKMIIAGGHHATFFAEDWVRRGINVVVLHEGEKIFPILIEALENRAGLHHVPGIVFIDRSGNTIRNETPPLVEMLDTLPMPRFDIIDYRNYAFNPLWPVPSGSLETSRGCPFSCEFCGVSRMWGAKYRKKSVERVLTELRELISHGVRFVFFIDDAFAADDEFAKNIFGEIAKRNFGINFWSFMRADTAAKHPELLKVASRAGLAEVALGFESLRTDMHSRMNKGYQEKFDADMYRRAYRNLSRNGIRVLGLFVSGYPGDPSGGTSLANTKNICDTAIYSRFTPLPHAKALSNIRSAGYRVPEIFYMDFNIPTFEKNGVNYPRFSLLHTIQNLMNLLRPGQLLKGLIPNPRVRPLLIVLGRGAFESVRRISISGLVTYLKIKKEKSIDERWRILKKRVLADDALDKLVKKSR